MPCPGPYAVQTICQFTAGLRKYYPSVMSGDDGVFCHSELVPHRVLQLEGSTPYWIQWIFSETGSRGRS